MPGTFQQAHAATGLQQLLCLLLLSTAVVSGLVAQTYEDGRQAYISGDYEQALDILRPLAEDGDSEAQKMLGIMYDYGHGVPASSEEALKWYLMSAEQGHPAVQYQVGAKYFRGEGVKQDYQEAARWWGMSASGGQMDAQFNLGLMYFRGLAIEPDDEQAAFLFSQAAEQGHGHAQYSLAVMYAFGRGVEKSYSTALEWFHRAAEQDIGQAQFNLGVFYENGYGVERDIGKALEWYGKAAVKGVAEADQKLLDLRAVETGSEAPVAATPTRSETGSEDSEAPPILPTVGAPADDQDANTITETTVALDASGIRRADWVAAQAPGHYTLQIGSVTREEDIVNFLRENGIENEAAYIQVVIKGVTRYNALYGVYESYSAANEAVESLPAGLRKVKPWVRRFAVLQKLLADSEQ